MKQRPAKKTTTRKPARVETVLPCVLVINGGSSSIKFALYELSEPLTRKLSGKFERIGLAGQTLTFSNSVQQKQGRLKIPTANHKSALNFLIDWLEANPAFTSV